MTAVPVKALALPMAAMVVVVVTANILVQYPIRYWGLEGWLTWGAVTFPWAFLVTDLTNRWFGSAAARRVVYVGFALGVVMSAWLATPRIAFASGMAFLAGQLLDVLIFDRLRRSAWWRAPLLSSVLASVLDTALFFSLAFALTGLPWLTWALGDFVVKVLMALLLLAPFRALMRLIAPQPAGLPCGAA